MPSASAVARSPELRARVGIRCQATRLQQARAEASGSVVLRANRLRPSSCRPTCTSAHTSACTSGCWEPGATVHKIDPPGSSPAAAGPPAHQPAHQHAHQDAGILVPRYTRLTHQAPALQVQAHLEFSMQVRMSGFSTYTRLIHQVLNPAAAGPPAHQLSHQCWEAGACIHMQGGLGGRQTMDTCLKASRGSHVGQSLVLTGSCPLNMGKGFGEQTFAKFAKGAWGLRALCEHLGKPSPHSAA